MGFLDSLLSRGTRKVLNNLVDNAVDRLTDTIDEKVGGKTAEKTTSGPTTKSTAKNGCTPALVMSRLEAAFASNYASYEVKKELSPTVLGGAGNFRPYTYALFLNGMPKAFIMVTEHNKDTFRTFRWSKEFAEVNGVPFINFLTQFPNTEEYIKKRLADNIK